MEHLQHVCYARRKFRSDGIEFVFTASDPFCGIDLDQCRTSNGKILPEAQTLIERLTTYTELSPSGTGIHILVKARLGGPGRRSGRIEIYDAGRYFTVTSRQVLHSATSVENRQVQLDELISEIFSRVEMPPSSTGSTTLFASDEELIERAKKAKNGGRFVDCGLATSPISKVITAAQT